MPNPKDDEPARTDETARMNALLAKLAQGGPKAPAAGPAPTAEFDELPVEQRVQRLDALVGRPPTSGEDQAAFGRLAASLARSAPDRLGADLLARVATSAPAARGFMHGVTGMAPAERATLLGALPVESRKQLFDELGTDGADLPHSVALVASLLQADPDLAAEAVAWGGEALARALRDQLGEATQDLPPAVRRAIDAQAPAASEAQA